MRYPTEMQVAGVTVPVHVQQAPVYTIYKCPVCRDADDSSIALSIYVPAGDVEHKCPACGTTAIQPTQSHIMGKFDYIESEIAISAPNEQVGGLNLVHETIEAIAVLCDLDIDHTSISTLGTQLYKAFASGNVDFTPRANVPSTTTVQ